MSVHPEHLNVRSRDKVAAAQRLAHLLGVPWSPSRAVGAARAATHRQRDSEGRHRGLRRSHASMPG